MVGVEVVLVAAFSGDEGCAATFEDLLNVFPHVTHLDRANLDELMVRPSLFMTMTCRVQRIRRSSLRMRDVISEASRSSSG